MKSIQIHNVGRQQRMTCENGYDLYDHDLIQVEILHGNKSKGVAYVGVTSDRRGWSVISSEGVAKDFRDYEFLLSII